MQNSTVDAHKKKKKKKKKSKSEERNFQ